MALLNDKWKECTLEYQEKCEEDFNAALKAAEAGDPFAQEQLWICYLGGCGVKKDEVKAQYWRDQYEAQRDKVLEIVKKKAGEGEDWAIGKYHALTTRSPLEDIDAFKAECDSELENLLKDPPAYRKYKADLDKRKIPDTVFWPGLESWLAIHELDYELVKLDLVEGPLKDENLKYWKIVKFQPPWKGYPHPTHLGIHGLGEIATIANIGGSFLFDKHKLGLTTKEHLHEWLDENVPMVR